MMNCSENSMRRGLAQHQRKMRPFGRSLEPCTDPQSPRICHQPVILASPPADGLLLISDARLPERPVGLLQAEGDGPLQVILIVSSQCRLPSTMPYRQENSGGKQEAEALVVSTRCDGTEPVEK
ncbi:hypothetical protein EYF80_027290 [Liparis tanakae]|uniref:Uncharacterized protein n=1 Tax=Liparis tanakae TaxID=230148 RepID=A0A4Z2H9B6_9TELE|nr:hypothetical protein EYF80_027290 [Liparis tanakae]